MKRLPLLAEMCVHCLQSSHYALQVSKGPLKIDLRQWIPKTSTPPPEEGAPPPSQMSVTTLDAPLGEALTLALGDDLDNVSSVRKLRLTFTEVVSSAADVLPRTSSAVCPYIAAMPFPCTAETGQVLP